MATILNDTPFYRVFRVFNVIILVTVAALCIFPMLHVFALSLSNSVAIQQGRVVVLPVELTTIAYEYLLDNAAFWRSLIISIMRVGLGLIVNMTLIVLSAYPLSQPNKFFPGRTAYVWYFLITMLFGGGLVPTFLVVRFTGLLDTMWALVLPVAVPVYNVILMLNFFRQLPRELSEAAYMDGAGHVTTLLKIYLPTSLPAIATISLFVMVFHWNEWFMAIIYIQNADKYPLQTYLRSVLIDQNFKASSYEDAQTLAQLSNRAVSAAQIFLGMLPILVVYPFLQKYFAKGIVLGSVKG